MLDSELDFTQLSVDERLEMISILWDSLDPEALPIPEWHRAELERRLADADANPDTSLPWELVRERLRKTT